ncbi:tRNA (N(6)-L-threonylcarbamoyladenosine(37)-C(2))-methylthiotransferase MtaB [Heliorestis acidaminivorans]|uniref:Threonylcarbamoyladenosine tRNA methylthiotransferase MtaB n=1 Tax=Heliorestis acidaminivorans TaxID=553427 RepID=A0A6I0F4S7_9FIRM|nr:tRNA (N(6)-L-threonylcarbamoyladenosine(37)-C(2))-methylthiotransferase MtaB [Heliorestis acidaminivorans]KAB2952287.1 tRNA (N(6)-L-threonylcarbamoyladenosine(37)-C(2))-methylthiotransferase MtaB [Heliorestis acidaminivorans]
MIEQSTVAFYTLGCKVNQGETDALSGLFKRRNYQIVSFDEPADVYVINTCTVTHLSDRKSRQIIRRAHRMNPQAVVVVTGCYAQVSPEEVQSIEGVDVIVGTDQRKKIVDLVEAHREAGSQVSAIEDIKTVTVFEEFSAHAEISRARATMKIQDGCNLFCTYCIIPYARGPVRSLSPVKVLEEAKRLIQEGFQEIVITGIHLGAYGTDIDADLGELVKALCRLDGLQRLRIGSIEPQEFTPSLLEAMTEKVLCPHFHIPLQSGSDKILKSMGRRYNRQDFVDIFTKIMVILPNVSITTDLIVGFPGESEVDFQETEQLCRTLPLAGIHVFPFSPRKGTKAINFPDQIAKKVKEERVQRIGEISRNLTMQYSEKFIGSTREVLLEEKAASFWIGHTDNYLKVYLSIPDNFMEEEKLRGSLQKVKLQALRSDGAIEGKVIVS